jgi:putative DNA primase/helicase
LAHTPAFFTLNALPFGYSPGAPAPVAWLAFLAQLWPEDPDAIATLQEIFGLSLTVNLFVMLLQLTGDRRGR